MASRQAYDAERDGAREEGAREEGAREEGVRQDSVHEDAAPAESLSPPDETGEDAAATPAAAALEDARQLAPDIGSARTPEKPTKRKMIDGGFLVVIVMAVVSGALVLALRGPERFFEILGDDLSLILAIAPKVAAAVLLAAWLRRLTPRETIARLFGSESGLWGMTLAVLAGIVLPGGPMTAFPIAVALGAAGADAGAAAAFLTSWLLLGANRTIVWEMAFIDHSVVGWRVLLSLPVPFLIGIAARQFGRPALPQEPEAEAEPAPASGPAEKDRT